MTLPGGGDISRQYDSYIRGFLNMKFIWQEGYDQMKSIVSRCWFEPNGHGLPPAFTSVLAGCQVGLHRVVYGASVDELGKWYFPEFQGDEADVTVLFWMPKPDVTLRVDTGFAFRADMMEAILFGVNWEAQLDAMRQRAEAAEAKLAAIPVDALICMLQPEGAVDEDADKIEMWIRQLKSARV